MGRNRRAFSPEFKREAVRLLTEGGQSVTSVARDLRVRPDQLRVWRRLAEAETPPVRRVEPVEEELRRVRRELDVVRQERDFLKKAAAFFAKGSA